MRSTYGRTRRRNRLVGAAPLVWVFLARVYKESRRGSRKTARLRENLSDLSSVLSMETRRRSALAATFINYEYINNEPDWRTARASLHPDARTSGWTIAGSRRDEATRGLRRVFTDSSQSWTLEQTNFFSYFNFFLIIFFSIQFYL